MKLADVLHEDCCEVVYCNADGEVLSESAIRQVTRRGDTLVRKYRCLAGPKKGKLVSNPSACSQRKDPAKVRRGRKVMRAKKGIIHRKGTISKRRSMSKIVRKMNQRLMGTN